MAVRAKRRPPLRALHVAAERFPLVKTGGLGDVLAALPPAQRALGLDARVLLPGYPAVLAALREPVTVTTLAPGFGDGRLELLRGLLPESDLPTYAILAPALYERPGNPYLGPDGDDWPDNAIRFGLLSWTAARLAAGGLDPGWRAEILHAHDWHAGLAPAYLKLGPAAATSSVFTVHNLAFQGLFPAPWAARLGLPAAAFQPDGLEFWGQLSFMKAGLVYADRITTVSPGYAREIATPDYGCGLDGVIRGRGAAVSGVLNGVDETRWDPAADPALVAPYGLETLDARRADRAALQTRFGLADAAGPLYGAVTRLTEQKGFDLVLDALPSLLAGGGALAVLGAGEMALEQAFAAAAAAAPGRVGVVIGYDEALAHAVFGGADVILVPSRFEPCGLTQLYAQRYGAVPVVRRTGGLGDTVVDATPAALAAGRATGVVFAEPTPAALAGAFDRVARLHARPAVWRGLQRAGMRRHFGWDDAAASYGRLYRTLRPSP